MQTFKPSETDMTALRNAAMLIKTGNKSQADGKKQTDAGKVNVGEWLKTSRQCDIANLSIGDMVNIEGVCLIECSKQSRFDLASFQLKHPALFAEFTKDFPTMKFKPLV